MEEVYKPERRFKASLILHGFKNRKNVRMFLFKADSENNTDAIDFAKAIRDYDYYSVSEYMVYAEDYIKELFTWEEVEAMREYFEDLGNVRTFDYSEANFPIPNITVGVGALAPRGPRGFCVFNKFEGYLLKFDVRGYYNLDYHELIEDEYER